MAPTAAVLDEAVAAAGLEGSWLAAADDAQWGRRQWDQAIEASIVRLGASSALAGGTALLPTLADVQRALFRGAVLSAPVTAVEHWDAIELLTNEPSFVALSPGPPTDPSFPVDNSRGGSANSVKLLR